MIGIFKRVTLLVIFALAISCTLSHPVLAQITSSSSNNIKPIDYRDLQLREVQEPDFVTMGADLLIARPLGAGATAVGAIFFVVSLPFSLLGGNVNQSFQQLVGVPGQATFFRCLGCEG